MSIVSLVRCAVPRSNLNVIFTERKSRIKASNFFLNQCCFQSENLHMPSSFQTRMRLIQIWSKNDVVQWERIYVLHPYKRSNT